MQRPEYWQDDETWATYERWLSEQPEPGQPRPLDRLATAIQKARGDPVDDVTGSIRFLNALSAIITGKR